MSDDNEQITNKTDDNTFYIFNPETNTIIPLKPDYSRSIPLTVPIRETVQKMWQQSGVTRLTETSPQANKELGIIVPLIKQPPNQSDWMQLATIARKYPRVNTIAIISPTRDERGIGDFEGADEAYLNGIRFLQYAGVDVAGYMDIDPKQKTLEESKIEIDRWREYYPDVTGLFFDNIPNVNGGKRCSELAAYARVDKGFRTVIADIASASAGGIAIGHADYVAEVPGVDIFVIYEKDGYPADAWYNNIRRPWMANYPRSRFAFMPHHVTYDALNCRNFIDKVVGIEKLAGYVYVHATDDQVESRRTRLTQWTNISPMVELTLDQLDREARQEGIPSFKGVTPEKTKVSADVVDLGGDIRNKITITDESITGAKKEARNVAGTTSTDEPTGVPASDIATDSFGIRMIYPTSKENNTWSLFMDNPRADANFKNLPDRLEKQADGSWRTTDDAVRLEAWSPKDKKFLNVEITGYFKPIKLPKTGNYVVQEYARGGHHYVDIKKWGEGSAYKGRVLKDGFVCTVKEIHHNAYTSNRATTQATNNELLNRWFGFKTIVYNYPKVNRKTGKEERFVEMEIWFHDNATDQDGNLVLNNDWKPIMKMTDEGGWNAFSTYNTKTKKGFRENTYSRLNVNVTGKYRKRDEVINSAGGTKDQNCVAWRWDKAVMDFKFLSVREIDAGRKD